MMNFRTIRDNIISILDTASGTSFVVTQGQKQREGSTDINNKKKVSVFFIRNDFKEDTGSVNGTVQSEPTYQIELKVSAKGKATDLTDPTTLSSAEIEADNLIDEFFDEIYQILMHADNLDLGMPIGVVNNRYIKSLEKGEPNPSGEKVILVGRADLTLKTTETVGSTGEVVGTTILNDMTINEDDVQKTGIEVDPDA
jgi:hypothetical protein